MGEVIKCKNCGDYIVSYDRHDMVWCECGAIAIDGGSDYTKITGKKEDFEKLSGYILYSALCLACKDMVERTVGRVDKPLVEEYVKHFIEEAEGINFIVRRSHGTII